MIEILPLLLEKPVNSPLLPSFLASIWGLSAYFYCAPSLCCGLIVLLKCDYTKIEQNLFTNYYNYGADNSLSTTVFEAIAAFELTAALEPTM